MPNQGPRLRVWPCVETKPDPTGRTRHTPIIRFQRGVADSGTPIRGQPYEHHGQAVDQLARMIDLHLEIASFKQMLDIMVDGISYANDATGIAQAQAQIRSNPPVCTDVVVESAECGICGGVLASSTTQHNTPPVGGDQPVCPDPNCRKPTRGVCRHHDGSRTQQCFNSHVYTNRPL